MRFVKLPISYPYDIFILPFDPLEFTITQYNTLQLPTLKLTVIFSCKQGKRFSTTQTNKLWAPPEKDKPPPPPPQTLPHPPQTALLLPDPVSASHVVHI